MNGVDPEVELDPVLYAAPTSNLKFAYNRSSVYDLAKQLASDNGLYFRCISSSQFRHRFAAACEALAVDICIVESIAELLAPSMLKYDYSAKLAGNGYRSLVSVIDSCVLHVVRLLRDIKEQREFLLFRTNYFCKELEAYQSVLGALRRDLRCVSNHLHLWKSSEGLFALDGNHLEALMNLVETFDHSCFYGRCMGFQYASSLYRVFQVVGFGLASYSILWERGAPDSISQTVTNLYHSGRFALNPEERSQRIADVIMNADITFCKSFWNLTEGPFLQDVPKWFCPTLAINEQWTIPARDPIFVESVTEGFYVKITQPSAHSGPGPISVRVLSYQKRAGMGNPYKDSLVGNYFEGTQSKSPNLLLHCHGGGFVATSSKSHEIYLRHWAKLLDCTVVSVDYALAPEHPYPRAVEEVLYAYAWVMQNADRLGWTGERICFAGDSAGGHILLSITLRAIQMTMRRLPDGLVLIYSPFLMEYIPSPSRLLSFLDPLLPPGIMARCVAAYLGVTETVSDKKGCIVKSPLTSSRATLAEYAFRLNHPMRHSHGVNSNNLSVDLPEYELNLGSSKLKKHTTLKNSSSVVSVDQSINGHVTQRDDVIGQSRVLSVVEKTPLKGKLAASADLPKRDVDDAVGEGDQKIISFCNLRNNKGAVGKEEMTSSKSKDDKKRNDCPNEGAFDSSTTDQKVEFMLDSSADQRTPDDKTPAPTLSMSRIPKHRAVFNRQRSQSDTVADHMTPTQKRLRAVDETDELLSGDFEGLELTEEMATVRIRKDPTRIVISAGAYDSDFVEYLNRHEMTSKSFVRLRVPSFSDKRLGITDGICGGGRPPLLSAPTTLTRSRSTSSLSKEIGEKLGAVTGYFLDGLASFMDTRATPNADDPFDSPCPSYDMSPSAKACQPNFTEGCNVLEDGSTAPPPTPSSALSDCGGAASTDSARRYGDVGASRLAHFHLLSVPDDPVLSPLRADDELLAKLPRVSLVALQLDPLLDDSITLAKRLRQNKVRVSLDLLDSLPHGFLNFTIFSPECRLGAKQCMERIKEIFEGH